ncbi:hypothetical protein [Pendulispora albinea]|uniref:Uncharacterized protein n=1 Tax=Pendulispora albinea TaxID=2741071 RepID=A0ABZ2MAR3_9BACT
MRAPPPPNAVFVRNCIRAAAEHENMMNLAVATSGPTARRRRVGRGPHIARRCWTASRVVPALRCRRAVDGRLGRRSARRHRLLRAATTSSREPIRRAADCLPARLIEESCADDVGPDRLERLIRDAHGWVDFIPNTKAESVERLTSAAVSRSLRVAVGGLRRMNVSEGVNSVFTTGDQLLWALPSHWYPSCGARRDEGPKRQQTRDA